MKSSQLSVALHLALVFGLSGKIVLAQTPPATAPATGQPPEAPHKGGMLSSITPEEKDKLIKTRDEVFTKNPELKTEGDNLKKQREAMQAEGNASPEDKMALMQSYLAHEKKMRAAMIKQDPSLEPVLDKLDQQFKQKMQRQGVGGN